MPAVPSQRQRQLFGGGDANIGNDAAMEGLGIIKIYNVSYKVRAITGDAAVELTIRRRVESADQSRVLLWAGFNLEAVARAVIRGTDKLVPVSARGCAVRFVRSDLAQMLLSIAITEKMRPSWRRRTTGFPRADRRHTGKGSGESPPSHNR